MGGRGERGVRKGATAWLEARGQSTRVPGFQAVHGDAGLGRGARTSSAGRQSIYLVVFIRPGGWAAPGARSPADSCNPRGAPWARSPVPCPARASGELEAGGPAFPLLTCPCSAHPGRAGHCESCLLTQLAAPGHPRPSPHHLQPGSARNSLGLLPSTRGLQPRVLPWPSGPCPGPGRGAKVGTGDRPAGMRRHQPGQLGVGAGRGLSREGRAERGSLLSAVTQMSPIPALFLPPPPGPPGAWVPAHPTFLSTWLVSCISVSWSLPTGLSGKGWQLGSELEVEGRGIGEGRQEGGRQFNFQSWAWRFRSHSDKKAISVMGF